MIVSDQGGRVHVLWGDPLIIALGESFPFDQVLECLFSPKVAVIDNFFDLLLFFSINHVRRGSGEVRSVACGFLVGAQE
jgi:hypothetical protein